MSFSVGEYLSGVDVRLLDSSEGRRLLTRLDPLMFALVYLPHHLRGADTGGAVSLSPFHVDMASEAKSWLRAGGEPMEHRNAYIAPRGGGKSTWAFLILPLWAAAHGHLRFVAAFAASARQAEDHLTSFKRELGENKALRADFPDLVSPGVRPSGSTVSDNRGMYYAKSKFVFAARGIDSSSLGLKIGNQRPDLLLFDDIEPDEANYSPYQKEQRLKTVRQSVFPMSIYAKVVMVGTTTMYQSIMHDVVRSVTDPSNAPEWVAEERIKAHYYPPILTNEDGSEASLWPEKWPLEFLRSIRTTRQYRLNYANQPDSGDGGYWQASDFKYGEPQAVTKV